MSVIVSGRPRQDGLTPRMHLIYCREPAFEHMYVCCTCRRASDVQYNIQLIFLWDVGRGSYMHASPKTPRQLDSI
jgi:hypothetical protein